ncbi:hypothetical protein DFH29DRAFT_899173 [Suillus ampliporus]|nr:hypothetical protein DFH29DRAFT_899173 [Suillus ampliporus]
MQPGELEFFLGCAPDSAPLLEAIALIDTPGSFHVPTMSYRTPAKFETPASRELILGRHVMLDGANAPMIKDLTHLEMNTRYDSRFLNILQGLLHLQTLGLVIDYLPPIYALPIITLPCLNSLRLVDTASDCSRVLQHIRAPCVKALTLIFSSQTNTMADLPVLLAAVSTLHAQNTAEIKHAYNYRINYSSGKATFCLTPSLDIRLAEAESSRHTNVFCNSHNTCWNPN